jgi:hypothetical protein
MACRAHFSIHQSFLFSVFARKGTYDGNGVFRSMGVTAPLSCSRASRATSSRVVELGRNDSTGSLVACFWRARTCSQQTQRRIAQCPSVAAASPPYWAALQLCSSANGPELKPMRHFSNRHSFLFSVFASTPFPGPHPSVVSRASAFL